VDAEVVVNYYYEVADACVKEMGGKYFAVYDKSGDSMMAGGYKLTQVSERIWVENPGMLKCLPNVRYLKNRSGPQFFVDPEEFFMVKLKCKRAPATLW
jgi:hypothetical protein